MGPDPLELQQLVRIVGACALGGVLGWERELAGKSAGLRTHMLVALTTALFVAAAEVALQRLGAANPAAREQFDPIRIVQAVAIGVGFLGGGVIRFADGQTQGVTTAASIWATAAVGLASGLGQWWLAGGCTLLIFVVLRLLTRFDSRRDVPVKSSAPMP